MMNLPKVHSDCCWPLEREVSGDRFLSDTARHMAETNPIVAATIDGLLDKMPECCKNAAMLAAFLTYRLLEIQADSDKLREDLHG